MRTSVAALALVRRATAVGGVEYLGQWNERWNAFHFIGGHKRPDESFRACCVREIEEELPLTEGQQFRVAAEPLAHLEYVAFSHGADAETAYTIELFEVELLGDAAQVVAATPANRWLSEADIRAQRCRDGRAVSDTMLRLLALAGLTPGEFDLFISYAHKDDHDGWVAALVDAIRAEHAQFTNVPLRIFFDREAIRTMDDWEHRILTGLRSAKVMLAVLSPNYVASDFCRREWETYLEHELALTLPGDGVTPIYTVTVPGFADGTTTEDRLLANLGQRQYVDARPWRTEGVAALRREEVRQRLQALEQDIDNRLRRAAQAAASATHALPGHNPNFVGRHDELRRLREILAFNQIGAIAAVQGIGGIGKTALAFEYAHGFAEHYPGGRFVLRAEGATDFRAAVVDQLRPVLGVELSDDEKKSYDLSFPRVWATLKGRGRSLLLLDNLDRTELLTGAKRSGVLPAGDAVHVVATTRLEPGRLEDKEKVQCLLLDALPPEDGLRLLRRYRDTAGEDEWKAALALVHRLGGHALALEVVGVFLWKNPEVSYRDYLARLEAEGAGAVEGAAEDERVELSRHPEKFIGRLLEPTLVKLTPEELRALEYAARLPVDAVPLPWLRALLERDLPEALTRRPGYADPWKQIERRLDGLRLVVQDPKEPRLGRIHRVVRDVVVARMGAEAATQRRRAATDHAMERAKFLWNGWVQREARWEINPIYFYALELLTEQDVRGGDLANRISKPLGELGRPTEQRSLLRRAIAIEEKAYDADHPTLAVSYSNLALVEKDLGNLAAARELLRRAIAIEEKAYDADHPTLAVSYSNLAMVEQALGNLAAARELLRRAIAINEKAYDADHPTLAVSYSNLAMVEQDLGNLAAARELLRRAIAIEEKAYDADHPTLAVSYSNLAMVEQALGNLAAARELLRRAIAINEKAYDADHPTLAVSYSNLALVEQDLGNLAAARELLRRAIAIEEKAYDADHPTLAVSYSNLAMVEQALGNLAAARELLRRAIAINEKAYDADHPTLAVSYSNLAMVEKALGNLAAARELLRRAIAIEEKAYDADHPTLAVSYSNLAMVEQALGNLAAARELLRRAIAINEKAYDADHPTLAVSYSNLALVEQALGNLAAARELLRRAIAINEKAYDADHPTLAVSYSNLALVEQALGNLAAARELLRRAIAINEKAYDADHPNLAVRYSNLAMVEKALGNLAAARELLRRAIAIKEKAYDADHPTLAVSYSNLAMVEQDLGNLAAARELLRRAIAINEKAYDADHPTLAVSYSNLAMVEQDLGNLAAARELLRRAIAIKEKAYDADHPSLATSFWNLSQVEQELGNLPEAVALARRAFLIWQARLGEQHPNTQLARNWLVANDPDFTDA